MPHAVLQALTAAGLALTLWVACAGVGAQILPRRALDRPVNVLPDWNHPGVAAMVGLGVLLFLGGAGTALHVPVWLSVVPFVVVGITLAFIQLWGANGPARPWMVTLSLLTVGAFILAALFESQIGLRAQINPCDELRAYLPMVHRLLDTNAIVEPWSYRRLQNLGGFTYLQAIPVRVLGDIGLGLAEFLIGAVFLGGLFVATGLRAVWTRVACLIFILSIPILWIPRINVAPVLFAVPILVGAFAATSEIRRALRRGERGAVVRWSVAAGVLLAALASVRVPNLPVAGATLVVGALSVSAAAIRDRLRAVAVAAAAATIAIVPWLLASWESVGTPLYPLITGNGNTAVPSERNPLIDTLGELAKNTLDYLQAGSIFWVALAAILFALIARKVLPDPWLVAIIAGATLASILMTSVVLSIASLRDFGRYVAPLGGGLAVFLFYETLRALDPAVLGGRERESDAPSRIPRVATVGFAILALAAVFTPLAVRTDLFTRLLPAGWSQLSWSSASHPGFVSATKITPPGLRAEWRKALKLIDPDRTIVAVDRPYLIDYRRYDLPNMDYPGWTTPTGDFPFFKGPAAKVAYLRKQGFDQLIITEPVRELCLLPTSLGLQLNFKPPYSTYARYFFDWETDVGRIASTIPGAVTRVGNLLIIDLPRAEAALSRQGVTER